MHDRVGTGATFNGTCMHDRVGTGGTFNGTRMHDRVCTGATFNGTRPLHDRVSERQRRVKWSCGEVKSAQLSSRLKSVARSIIS